MSKIYRVEPRLGSDVSVGSVGDGNRVLLGGVAEAGSSRRVWFNASKEFVGLVVGKRGSGKSYTVGSILEGFATTQAATSISEMQRGRAVLLLDPMGNFWTTAVAVRADGPEKVRAQWEDLRQFGCEPADVDATIWLPAGFKRPADPPGVREFTIRISDLDARDWADLLDTNLIRDPQGIALADAFLAVTEEGWHDGRKPVAAKVQYELSDLIAFLEHQRQLGDVSDHAPQTLRALIRTFKGFNRLELFSSAGTPLPELLRERALSVLMLPFRVGHDLRRVITRVLIRRILREREFASQIRQRLDVDQLDDATRAKLENTLSFCIPKSIVAIDEAQELLGEAGEEAKTALEDFCLLGRNYGLSLILATQRPTSNALSARVLSQVDTYVIHRLLTQEDVETARRNLLAPFPDAVHAGSRSLSFEELVRGLDIGQAIVSSSNMISNGDPTRSFILKVRPRVTVHGGEVE
jgi:uncharacterized protein